jgi:hypothetical protein
MVKCVTSIGTVFAILTLMLVTLALPVLAAFYQGTPSPSLSPVFGTLVNFDDKPSDTVIAWDDYVSVGVASITETQGPWPLMRLDGTQSMPNYVGTGDAYNWSGTILIEFTNLANKVGIGIANSAGGPEVLNIYDIGHNLLESQTAPSGLNIYVYFQRSSFDIKYFEIVGDIFAVDDLQFYSPPPPTPPPAPNCIYLHCEDGLFNLTEPVDTQWHELWPIFCREYHLSSWNDTSGDGVLSYCDQIDMYQKPDGEVRWYHVESVTITLFLTPSEMVFVENGLDSPQSPLQGARKPMYIELEGGFNSTILMNPICTYWHEIYPKFCKRYHLSSWDDTNFNNELDFCDMIDLTDEANGAPTFWHVEDVAIDIVVCRQPPPVGGEAYPVSKASLLAPWIATGLVMAGGTSWFVLRRRRAQS